MSLNNVSKIPLVIDDVPLDSILYGETPIEPTPADCFLLIKEHMQVIRDAYNAQDQANLLAALITITDDGMALPQSICDEIIEFTLLLIPNVPLPVLPYDISRLTPLLEQIWTLPNWGFNYEGKKSLGERLYRCYEHQRQYAKAQDVLRSLIRLAQDRRDGLTEAVYTNNLAFEYLLEKRYHDALTLFQRAQTIFLGENNEFQSANSRANYLICLFELGRTNHLVNLEDEIKLLTKSLSENGEWHARKPYALLAEIRASENDLSSAIGYIRQAIKATENHNLKWTEIDKKRLEELEAILKNATPKA